MTNRINLPCPTKIEIIKDKEVVAVFRADFIIGDVDMNKLNIKCTLNGLANEKVIRIEV